MTIARKSMLKLYFFSIDFYQYSRMQFGLDPLQLAVFPDRTQFLVAVPPVSRYPKEQEKVQWDPAALLELVQEMRPCAGADRGGEQRATGRIRNESVTNIEDQALFYKIITILL